MTSSSLEKFVHFPSKYFWGRIQPKGDARETVPPERSYKSGKFATFLI